MQGHIFDAFCLDAPSEPLSHPSEAPISRRQGLLHGTTHPALTPQNRHRTVKTPPWIVPGRAGNLCIQSDVLLERMTGIEPAPSAWKAEVLPLNYIRVRIDIT